MSIVKLLTVQLFVRDTGCQREKMTYRFIIGSLLLAVIAVSLSGCGGGSSKSPSPPTTPKIVPPKIAEKPDVDELDQAVIKANGDIVAALKAIDAPISHKEGAIGSVDLSGKKVTAKGLAHLLQLKETLQRVSLNDAYVTTESLKILVQLSHLRRLDLNRTPLTDTDCEPLVAATQLRELSLRETAIGDVTLQHLSGLKELRHLSLSGTKVTNSGVSYLEKLPELNTLMLENTVIDNDAFPSFHQIKTLRFLLLSETKVTADEVNQFRAKHEQINVKWTQPVSQ